MKKFGANIDTETNLTFFKKIDAWYPTVIHLRYYEHMHVDNINIISSIFVIL